MPAAARSEQFRYRAGRLLAQRNKIDRLAPSGRLLAATSRHHFADDRRQHGCGVLPADQVDAFERLIDKIEGVSGVGERPLSYGREQIIGEHTWRDTGRDRREQGTLSRLAMAHACPTPQPAL